MSCHAYRERYLPVANQIRENRQGCLSVYSLLVLLALFVKSRLKSTSSVDKTEISMIRYFPNY